MQYNSTKETKELLSIFSSDTFSIEEDNLENILKDVVSYYVKHTRHQYHIVSQYVNERMSESQDAISYILNNIDGMMAFLFYKKSVCEEVVASISSMNVDDIILNLEKLYDHIALEEERINNNSAIIRRSNEQIEGNVINTFNSIMDSFQTKVDEISNSLNANIITVVGLFSAIIFVFFGGLTSLSDVINGVWKVKDKEELIIPLIIILVIGFIIFNTIFLLLYSIAKIVDKNIGSSVTGWNSWWYYVGEMVGKCCKSKTEAERRAKKRNYLSRLKAIIQQIVKKIFFRFPYVVLINAIMILGIIYLYLNI